MKRKAFYKELFIIAVPIMIQYLITSSINLIDTLMIGALGEKEIASIGIANQYYFLFSLILIGVYSGCNVLIAQFWGKKDTENIKRVLGISLIIGIALSIIFIFGGLFFNKEIIFIFNKNNDVIDIGSKYLLLVCISYIFIAISQGFGIASRGIGKTVTPMVASAIALGFNILFNYVLIFGHMGFPALGVIGAAIATNIARAVEMVLIVFYIYYKKGVLAAKIDELLDLSVAFTKKVVKSINPVVVNELCWGSGVIVYSIVYGNLGTEAMASVQISNTIQNIFMVILFGIANAACVMIGNRVGEEDIEGSKEYSKILIKLSLIISIIIAFALALSSKKILSYYNISKYVYDSTLIMLMITAVIFPARFINVLLIIGILRGGGDIKYALRIELLTMWIVGVPMSIIGAYILKLPVYYVFALVTLEEITKCVFSIKRYRSGKWIRNIVSEISN